MKTLIVEDDTTTRSLLEALLRRRGREVTAVADGESAWALCRDNSYPLIVLDWLLPGMDGLELCRRIRLLAHGDESVIIILTGRDRPEDLHLALDAGADDYLTKPVDAGRLDVRLAVAERQVVNMKRRKEADRAVADLLAQVQRSHHDLVSILNRLRLGVALTDEHGRVIFLSDSCRGLFGSAAESAIGKPWEEFCPFDPATKVALKGVFALPEHERGKVPASIVAASGRRYWVEVEVRDDPRDPRGKIFLMYDMTETHDLRELLSERWHFHRLTGKSDAIQSVFRQVEEVAPVDATVLIEGETGSGKELVARAIHSMSHRAKKPFVALNCAGLTESILGSQLFGHKRGAFTGAIQDHKGMFEAADGGTIFLDEIGDVPASVQANLLRVLQEREITRLGESTPRKIDVRVLAATHHDLAEDVTQGAFRADLLYRIRVARIRLPPLRERREDVPLLAADFLKESRASMGRPVQEISQDAMALLVTYPWPGNARELKAAVEYAVIRCRGSVLIPEDFPEEIAAALAASVPVATPVPEVAAADEKTRFEAALAASKGNRAEAARRLGISRATFYRRLAALDLAVDTAK